MKNLEWEECLCKWYIYDCSVQSKYWKVLSERNVYANVTYMTVVFKVNTETSWVRWMFMWMLHIKDSCSLKVNMKTIERDECLCECYICSVQSKYWKVLSEKNVYVNVTYDSCSLENLDWDECLCECYIWPLFSK
jgi:hypothetical protein